MTHTYQAFEPATSDMRVVVVNTPRSQKSMDILSAASGSWPATISQIDELLQTTLVIAVVSNVIRGVFKVISSHHGTIDPNAGRTAARINFELVPAPAYSGLVGHRLLDDGTHWVQGDGSAWKRLPTEELDRLLDKANVDRVPFGPHFVTLRPDGNLEVELAEGTNVNVRSVGKPQSMKEQIAAVVHAVAKAGILCTYGAIAEMVGNSSTPSVSRSIVRNKGISPQEAACALPWKFFDGKFWVVPMVDPEWTPGVEPDGPQRAELLIKEGLAVADGDVALVEDHLVIRHGATLRRYLNI